MNAPLPLGETLASIRRAAVAAASRGWPELGALIDTILPERLDPFALLPIATGRAAGGSVDQLIPAAAAVVLLSISLRIVDDCADQDNPRSLDHELGIGRAVNAAMALSAAATSEIALLERRIGHSPGALDHSLRAILDICRGQDRDMQQYARTFDEYREIVRHKTIRGYELAGALGARIACADAETISRAATCGAHLGWMTQILDDIEAMWFPTEERLRENKRTFPLLYGLTLEAPEATSLRALAARDRLDSAAIRATLDRMNVREELLSIALDHRDSALACLGEPMHAEGRQILKLWLDSLLAGAARLMEKVAEAPSRSPAPARSEPAYWNEERGKRKRSKRAATK